MTPPFKISSIMILGLFATSASAFMLCAQQNADSVEGAFVVIRTLCNTNERQISAADFQNLSISATSSSSSTPQNNNNVANDNMTISVINDYNVSAKNIVLKNNEIERGLPGSFLSMNYDDLSLFANKAVTIKTESSIFNLNKDIKVDAAKKLIVEAGDEILLKTGKASITLKKDGTVTIKGSNITLDASSKINAKASNDVVLKGSTIISN